MARIRIDPARCIACGRCVDICPEALFKQARAGAAPRMTRPKACITCGHCVSICPAGAVIHADFPTAEIAPLAHNR